MPKACFGIFFVVTRDGFGFPKVYKSARINTNYKIWTIFDVMTTLYGCVKGENKNGYRISERC